MADQVEQLLREADARATRAALRDPAALSDRVWQAHRRRTRRRRTLGAAAALLLAVAAGMIPFIRHTGPRASIIVTTAVEQRSSIKDEIAFQEQLIGRMLTNERRKVNSVRLASLEFAAPASSADESLERAAARIVYETDRLFKSSGQTDPAVKGYSSVIECFPETGSAQTARQRLSALKKVS